MRTHRPLAVLTLAASALCLSGLYPAPAAATDSLDTSKGVARSAFATEIRDREPVDPISTLPADQSLVFFFTELVGLEGETIVHRWEHDGEIQAEVRFEVRGPRWRVYSSKQLLPAWTGEWKVRVLRASGEVLHEDAFAYAPSEESSDDTPAALEPTDD